MTTDLPQQVPESDLPYRGIRILDLTHGVAGPVAAMLLGDMGADVLKVEKPNWGDPARYMNVSVGLKTDFTVTGGDYFLAVNRNKRSITVDIKQREGQELLLALAERCDVVLQSYRPGVLDRYGLGFEGIRAVRPDVIYGTISAYGNHGPLGGQPGMDVAAQARAGLMAITGYPGLPPVKPGASLADMSAGIQLVLGVQASLYRRASTGNGGEVHISLLGSTLFMLSNYAVAVVDGGARVEPMGSGHPQIVPFQAFRASDGFIVFAVGTNKLFRSFCAALGLDGLATDPRFRSNETRVENREALIMLLESKIAQKTIAEWLGVMEALGIPSSPVNELHEAFADEQVKAEALLREMSHPVVGKLHVVRPPQDFDGDYLGVRRPSPLLGQHTEEVLTELLEIPRDRFDSLRERGIV